MLKRICHLSLLTLCVNHGTFAQDVLAPELHTDPFVNPVQAVLEANNTQPTTSQQGEAPASNATPRETFLWQPEIRGIIRSDDMSIVNIGGDMIEPGMEYEGFRLIKVKGQSVVFEKNGKQVSISMEETE